MTKAVDARVTVPMAAGVDSFSVNAAAAVILYEIRRREGLSFAPEELG
jgi:tRNA G18 (ribose-2'-O)-methylase SpoU